VNERIKPARVLSLLLLALLLALAAGCGDDDGDSGGDQAARTGTTATTGTETEKAETETTGTETAADGGESGDEDGDGGGGSDGGSGSSGGSGARIARADFVRRADRICRTTQQQLARDIKPDSNSPSNVTAYTSAVTKGLRRAADRVEALGTPTSGPSPKEFLAAERAKLDLIDELGDALKGQDAEKLQAVAARASRAANKTRRLGKAQGFKVCGQV
jgi:hypothetical protein